MPTIKESTVKGRKMSLYELMMNELYFVACILLVGLILVTRGADP